MTALGRRCHSQPPERVCHAAADLRREGEEKNPNTQVFVVCPCLEAARCFSISERVKEVGEGEEKEIPSWFSQGDRQQRKSPLEVNKLSCNMLGRRGQLLNSIAGRSRQRCQFICV